MSETMTSNRLVVGVDRSASAPSAVAWAARWASARGVPLTLLTAVPPVLIDPGGVTMVTGDMQEAAQRRAGEHLTQVRDEVIGRHPSLEVQLVVADTVAGQALTDASGPDQLVVVGTHARTGLLSRVMGSTADQVATHARGPVVVVPEGEGEPRTGPMVVGVDASAAAMAALEVACGIAAADGIPVLALHAWDLDYGWAATPVGIEQNEIRTMLENERGRLAGDVEAVAGRFPGVEVETQIQRNSPAHALVEASQTASLVVVGSRGRGGFVGLLLGSTSRKVLHGSACPVIVVPARG